MKRLILLCIVATLFIGCSLTPQSTSDDSFIDLKNELKNCAETIQELRVDLSAKNDDMKSLENAKRKAEMQLVSAKLQIDTYKTTNVSLENENQSLQYELAQYNSYYTLSSINAKAIIEDVDQAVIKALKEKDYASLALHVHPKYGVRLTPYSFVDLSSDIVVAASELLDSDYRDKVQIFGTYDGEGDDIALSFNDYNDLFIYSADFMNPDDVTYNAPKSTGNMYDNHRMIYGNAISVDHHFDGINEQFLGMDWVTLRLIYHEYNGKWYLVGIIHNQWTI